jgi:NADPH:quinone reductase-like Zn-dependent oxidoreductase
MNSLARIIKMILAGWIFTAGGMPMGGVPSLEAQNASDQRAVLVTGASSGIGRKTAELLASRGFFVYAGARSEQDLRELNTFENIQSIRLDVTIALLLIFQAPCC